MISSWRPSLFTQLWVKSTTSNCGQIGLKSPVENTTGGVQYPSAKLLSDISSTWMCKLVPEELFPPLAGVFDEKILSSFLRTAGSFCPKLCVGRTKESLFQFYCQAEYFLQGGPRPSESAAKVSTLLSHRGNRGTHKHRPDNKGHFYHVPILEFFSEPKRKFYSA